MNCSSVPVDLLNPGQVFACLGLMEMTEILAGHCKVRFNYAANETACLFEISSQADKPVEDAVRFLAQCRVVAVAPDQRSGERLSAAKWGVETEEATEGYFPGAPPDSPATLPVRLRRDDIEIPIEHWMDGPRVDRDNVKFWAGAGGYPGAALARDALSVLPKPDENEWAGLPFDPFSWSAPMDSSFRFDWRRDYIPLDAGFSPNEQKAVGMVGFPLVEVLAAIGLQNARPARVQRRDKLSYRYRVSNVWLPASLARAALGAPESGLPVRTFRMQLGWPGKKNQARCIINAEEE